MITKGLLLVLAAGLAEALPAKGESFPTLGLANITRRAMQNSTPIDGRGLSGESMDVDFPDPSIIWGDGSWKAYATSSNNKHVAVATSSDASSWILTSYDALPDPGPWVNPNDQYIWAPDVQKNDAGIYVMYYTAPQTGGTHCIGVATSRTAVGPFKPQSTPLICDQSNGGVIDASGYDDGVDRWILWKIDGNNLGGATTCQGGAPSGSYMPTPIMIQRMARDATTLLGSPSQILDNEGRNNDGVVEAPALYKMANGNYILFYSSHCYSSDDYDIEYAFSSTINGPYRNRGILLRTVDSKGIYGPGGLDIDPNGHSVVFHGRVQPGGQGPRELFSAELTISGESPSV